MGYDGDMVLVTLLLSVSIQTPPSTAPQVTPETLEGLIEFVVPTDEELKWRSVPWRPTLFDGLRDGAAKDKPVLLWAMNGHPLGST